ncbi:flagellar biosynthetic protein FliR [Rhodopirellula sp. JC639]|uniref:flagellar biosynthetic protein FliR n=1 Tax=Stieleria mannarensis TaxID=2755585 RepID=UPI0016003ECB|nr:flagellar biosynthetic protein FliR [Rhodopirellula sp. JC639]
MNFYDTLGDVTGQWLLHQLMVSAMVACRLGGLVAALPVLSSELPMRIRVLLVLAITLVLVPGVGAAIPSAGTELAGIEILFSAGREVIFGMIIGGVVQLLVSGVSLAGELISNATGMQLAQTADPSSGEPVPQLSRLLGLLVTAVLFAVGGHRLLIDALLTSFHRFPPMTVSIDQTLSALVIDHLAIGIESGLRVAAPVVACVMLTNLVVALVSRTVPQLNVLAIGLNINVMAALLLMALTIGSAGLVFETELSNAITRLGLQ